MPKPLRNESIIASEVRLIDHIGADLGIVPRAQALALARDHDCDLVQDAAFSSPPLCRLEPNAARDLDARDRRIASGEAKEIRIGATMGAHDLQARIRHAEALLGKGYTVKLTARLAPSERANPAAARALLLRLAGELPAGRDANVPRGERGTLVLTIEPR